MFSYTTEKRCPFQQVTSFPLSISFKSLPFLFLYPSLSDFLFECFKCKHQRIIGARERVVGSTDEATSGSFLSFGLKKEERICGLNTAYIHILIVIVIRVIFIILIINVALIRSYDSN